VTAVDEEEKVQVVPTISGDQTSSSVEIDDADPLNFGRHRRENVSQRQMKIEHPKGNKKKLKKYYTRQNELIDRFLGADDEERLLVEEMQRMGPRIKFAVTASFTVNFFLFVIQMYAAISTGSLSVSQFPPTTSLPERSIGFRTDEMSSFLRPLPMPL
jgi:hypothetical protein